MCANFQWKWTTLNFSTQICPKIDLGLETEKANVGIRISIVEMLCVPIFRQNGHFWLFRSKFAQKWILGSGFQKSRSRFGISTSKIICVPPIFSLNGQLFGLDLGKLSNYMRYFGSNNVERAGGGWWSLEHGLVIPNFKHKMKSQSILQKVVYEKFYVHEKIFNRDLYRDWIINYRLVSILNFFLRSMKNSLMNNCITSDWILI